MITCCLTSACIAGVAGLYSLGAFLAPSHYLPGNVRGLHWLTFVVVICRVCIGLACCLLLTPHLPVAFVGHSIVPYSAPAWGWRHVPHCSSGLEHQP